MEAHIMKGVNEFINVSDIEILIIAFWHIEWIKMK